MIRNSIVLIIFCQFFISCQGQRYYLTQGEIFRTSFQIKYEYDKALGNEISEALKLFDQSLNPFNKESVIYKINNNISMEADPKFIMVFNKAREVSERSNGAFDVTCAPLINLWGFGFSRVGHITPEAIDSLKQFVGYRKVRLNGTRIVKDDPRIILNASAIAKGYACDVIAALMESYNIRNYMVDIGGEIRMKGKNPDNVCWQIEITKPIDNADGTIRVRQEVVRICDGAVATSGNYRNFRMKDGKKYGHTIDPRTGHPSEQNILSATVIASDCMTADAYATTFMVLGLDESVKLARQLPELAYYFVYADINGKHQVAYSDNMQQYLIGSTFPSNPQSIRCSAEFPDSVVLNKTDTFQGTRPLYSYAECKDCFVVPPRNDALK